MCRASSHIRRHHFSRVVYITVLQVGLIPRSWTRQNVLDLFISWLHRMCWDREHLCRLRAHKRGVGLEADLTQLYSRLDSNIATLTFLCHVQWPVGKGKARSLRRCFASRSGSVFQKGFHTCKRHFYTCIRFPVRFGWIFTLPVTTFSFSFVKW